MILLVAEKPSVATQHYRSMLERCTGEQFQQHEGYLQGKEHCITWCVGHLITLAPFDKYPGFEGPWQLGNLPMLPQKFQLEPIERTTKQLHIVQGLMNQASVIINGADAGREGNLIFDLILDYTPEFKKKEIRRLWVNSYVAKELDAAWKNLEDAQKRINLSYAARLRQRADWMVGLNATRAYTLTAGRGKLISVGRVQTPTLNLIVQRDFQVENFKEHFFYGVLGTWNGFAAQWIRDDQVAYLDDSQVHQQVVERCTDQPATLTHVDIKKKSQFPPKPFDLTELQKEANKRFKINVQQVLDTAQVLYEKKLLTYPRTDSAYLPESMLNESYQLAQSLANPKQKALLRPVSDSFVFINSEKVTDHYAIIPTGETPSGLSPIEQQIYDLALERFVVAWMQPYVWSEFQAQLQCENELFRIKLKKPEQEGYKALVKEEPKAKKGKKNTENTDDEIENVVQEFPQWDPGISTSFNPIELHKKKKSKPKYYTEATLLAAMKTAGKQIDDEDMAEAMKDRGLGTPATQAGIIETLKKRGFVEAQKNNIVSTPRGRQVIALMDDKIKSPEMTGEWEYKLSLVEKGEFSPTAFRDGIVDYVQQLFASLRHHFTNQFNREQATSPLPCPLCQAPLNMVPWGYTCESMGCNFRIGHTVAQRSLTHEEMQELLTHKKTPLLSGFVSKKGSRFSASLFLDEKNEIQFAFDDSQERRPFSGACPLCQAGLLDVGNRILCEKECGFTLYKTTAGVLLEEPWLHALLTEGRTPLIHGFTSKKGNTFSAHLCLENSGKTRFEFVQDGHFSGEASKFQCPLCHAQLKENKNTVFCDQSPCTFTLFKKIAGKKLRSTDIKSLFTQGQTEVIQGFVNKQGQSFDASLRLDPQGRAVFDFPRNTYRCPRCGMPMHKSSHSLDCTQAPCGFQIPLVINERALSDSTLEQLIEKQRTDVLEGFVKNGTLFDAALIIRTDGKIGFDLTSVVVKKS